MGVKTNVVLGGSGALVAFVALDTIVGGFFGDTLLDKVGIDIGEIISRFQEDLAAANEQLEGEGLGQGGETVETEREVAEVERDETVETEREVAEVERDETVETEREVAEVERDETVETEREVAEVDEVVATGFEGGEYTVERGDKLDSLITEFYGEDLTYAERVAIAEEIVSQNPDAFKDGNPHFMFGGADLTLPPEASVTGEASAEFAEKYGDANLHPGASSASSEAVEEITDIRDITDSETYTPVSEDLTATAMPELSGVAIPVEGMPYGDTVVADLMTSPNGQMLMNEFGIDLREGLITEVDGEPVIERLNPDGSTEKILLADADPDLIRSAATNTATIQELASEMASEARADAEPVTGTRIAGRGWEETAFEKAADLTSSDYAAQASDALIAQGGSTALPEVTGVDYSSMGGERAYGDEIVRPLLETPAGREAVSALGIDLSSSGGIIDSEGGEMFIEYTGDDGVVTKMPLADADPEQAKKAFAQTAMLREVDGIGDIMRHTPSMSRVPEVELLGKKIAFAPAGPR